MVEAPEWLRWVQILPKPRFGRVWLPRWQHGVAYDNGELSRLSSTSSPLWSQSAVIASLEKTGAAAEEPEAPGVVELAWPAGAEAAAVVEVAARLVTCGDCVTASPDGESGSTVNGCGAVDVARETVVSVTVSATDHVPAADGVNVRLGVLVAPPLGSVTGLPLLSFTNH